MNDLESNSFPNGCESKKILSLIRDFESLVHSNHFRIFKLKEDFLNLPDLDSNADGLETKLIFNKDILDLSQILDPGITVRRAQLLKSLATNRIKLSELKMKSETSYTKQDHLKQLKFAMNELKLVSQAFKFPEKIVATA